WRARRQPERLRHSVLLPAMQVVPWWRSQSYHSSGQSFISDEFPKDAGNSLEVGTYMVMPTREALLARVDEFAGGIAFLQRFWLAFFENEFVDYVREPRRAELQTLDGDELL